MSPTPAWLVGWSLLAAYAPSHRVCEALLVVDKVQKHCPENVLRAIESKNAELLEEFLAADPSMRDYRFRDEVQLRSVGQLLAEQQDAERKRQEEDSAALKKRLEEEEAAHRRIRQALDSTMTGCGVIITLACAGSIVLSSLILQLSKLQELGPISATALPTLLLLVGLVSAVSMTTSRNDGALVVGVLAAISGVFLSVAFFLTFVGESFKSHLQILRQARRSMLEKVYRSLGPLIFACVIVEELVTYRDWLAIPPGVTHMIVCILLPDESGGVLHMLAGQAVFLTVIARILIWNAWWAPPTSLVLAATCLILGSVNISQGISPSPAPPAPDSNADRTPDANEVELQQVV